MDKRIKMSQEEMCNYFIREQKVMEYGAEFFKDLCACSISTENCIFVNDKVIPLSCYNEMDEYLYAVEHDLKYAIQGGFVKACKKQAYIRIGIDTSNSILNKKLKQTIRHEIIHYYLWILGLPHDDDSLEFWCLCYVYDANAYQELSVENQKYYEIFKSLYSKHVADLQWNVKHLLTGQMISALGENSVGEYEDYVIDIVRKTKKRYGLE